MKKKAVDEKQKVVELKQLVSQPQCLKLLILHTPFTLNLDSLHLCINLVKLDLSKNNLTSFPYLGQLPSLKFMFIHDNKLEIDNLVGIFQDDIGKQTRSPLSKAVIWVTYWGNRNQFNARHYLVNHTSVLAVDHHLVAHEEKNQSIFVQRKFIQPFSPITDISQIFQNRKKFNKNATEQQYMTEFWEDMSRIRKKHIQIYPIIKIQKVFRGWSYRNNQQCRKQQVLQGKQMMCKMFFAWRKQAKFEKKLKLIFKKKDKSYLLLPIKQMKLEAAKRKIIAFVQATKKRILLRKMNLKSQYKFFNVLKSNQQALKSLYNVLHIDLSSYLMVHIDGIEQFKKYVIPVASSMNGGIQLSLEDNMNIALRSLYEPPRKRRQFLRLLQLNQKSVVTQIKQPLHEVSLRKKNSSNYTVYKLQTSMSRIYDKKNVHFSASDVLKMENINKYFKNKNIMDLSELKKINGSRQVLKDIVRGCFFYNMGYLTNCAIPTQKINFLSEYSIRKISAIIKIQRMWRGANLRKKIKDVARKNFIINRAAVKIQRWYRNLARSHRQQFMFNAEKQLKTFQNQTLYVQMDNYLEHTSKNNREDGWMVKKMSFPEQHIKVFICGESKKILISWDSQAQNEGAFINSRIGKKLFTQKFIKNVFGNWDFKGPIVFGQEKKYQQCEISHLFHYRTQVSIINRKNSQYLEIKCASKQDCRLRVLALKLLTYNFHNKNTLPLHPKQSLNFYSSQLNFKKPITNPYSIFVSQNKSEFEIEALNKESSKTFELLTKFYINSDENKKPIKFATVLKVIMVTSENKDVQVHRRQAKSVSYNDNFDLQSFLIAQTNQVRLDKKNVNIVNPIFSANSKNNKESLKNMKLDRKLKLKNREKIVYSQHSENKPKQKFNFMLGDPHYHQRLTTQPDLLTHERSMGSIAADPAPVANKDSLHKSDIKIVQSRILTRKKAISNASDKTQSKNIEQFTKNFINQGNFIQNQFLYGQIKRLKTQIQRNSVDQVARIKTQQDQKSKFLQRFKDDKIKRAQEAHLRHKEEQFRSVIQKHSALESKQKQKSEVKQANYKSLPRKMRINFAQQCYPLMGKYPHPHNLPKDQ